MYKGNIHPKLEAAATKLYFKAPFWAEFLLNMDFLEAPPNSPAKTIGVSLVPLQLIWNREWVDSLSEAQVMAALIHEVMHILSATYARRPTGANVQIWNMAADFVINHEITTLVSVEDEAIELPENGCNMVDLYQIGFDGDITHEAIYSFLKDKLSEEQDKQQQQSEGEESSGGSEGSGGQGSQSPSGEKASPEMGEGFDDHSTLNELTLDDIEAMEEVIEDIKRAGIARQAGKGTANIEQFLRNLANESQVPWKMILQRKMLNLLHKIGNQGSRTWVRPSRRKGLPMKAYSPPKLCIAFDTSGSIFGDEDVLSEFFTEIEKLAKTNEISYLSWDTEITSVGDYKKGDWKSLQVKGGGGTDVQCVFDWLEENKRTKDALIILTDGEFNHGFNPKGKIDATWVVYNNADMKLPHGTTINVPARRKVS